MKILVCEFHQETNSFNPVVTGLDYFEKGGIYEDEEICIRYKDKPCTLNGMVTAIAEAGGKIIPAYSMRSQSGGRVDHMVLEQFIDKMAWYINNNLPLDGLFISLHGATETTKEQDACGLILEMLRRLIGEKAVIAASCDMHANVTDRMASNADYICGYQTYPHEDYFETGYRAAQLGIRRIRTGGKPYMIRTVLPMIVPASGYNTQDDGPFRQLMEYAKELVAQGKIDDFSIFQMQPWLDVRDAGSSILVIADDISMAKSYVIELAKRLLALRDQLWPELWDVDAIIDRAVENMDNKPIVLVDCADSTNAGAPGNSIAVVRRLLERKLAIRTAFVLNDAPAVAHAREIGVGNTGTFSIGGDKTPELVESLVTQAYVKSFHDGIFMQEGPAGKGMVNNIGPAAVLAVGNIDILVCHNTAGNGDPQLYRHFGIEPLFYQLVVVKACTSFRAAYTPLAAGIYTAKTPGAASADLRSFRFRQLPKGFYPFEDLDSFQVAEPVCIRSK